MLRIATLFVVVLGASRDPCVNEKGERLLGCDEHTWSNRTGDGHNQSNVTDPCVNAQGQRLLGCDDGDVTSSHQPEQCRCFANAPEWEGECERNPARSTPPTCTTALRTRSRTGTVTTRRSDLKCHWGPTENPTCASMAPTPTIPKITPCKTNQDCARECEMAQKAGLNIACVGAVCANDGFCALHRRGNENKNITEAGALASFIGYPGQNWGKEWLPKVAQKSTDKWAGKKWSQKGQKWSQKWGPKLGQTWGAGWGEKWEPKQAREQAEKMGRGQKGTSTGQEFSSQDSHKEKCVEAVRANKPCLKNERVQQCLSGRQDVCEELMLDPPTECKTVEIRDACVDGSSEEKPTGKPTRPIDQLASLAQWAVENVPVF